VKKQKTKNIIKDGPDAEILRQYKKQVQDIAQLGAKRALTEEEQQQIADAKKNIDDILAVADVPDDGIQIDIFNHNAKTGEFTKSAIYTKAEKPLTTSEIEEHMQKAAKETGAIPPVALAAGR